MNPSGSEAIPIFPLAATLLFPDILVPLHIFEPRYRQMTHDALRGDRRIGMVSLKPGAATHSEPPPPVFPFGCCGVVERAQRRADGRYDISLRGTHRFRIREETPLVGGRLYRVARVESLPDLFDPAREAKRLAGLRRDLHETLATFQARMAPQRPWNPQWGAEFDDLRFVNTLCGLLDAPAEEKQGLLEASGVVERGDRLLALLRFRLAELGTAIPSRSLH